MQKPKFIFSALAVSVLLIPLGGQALSTPSSCGELAARYGLDGAGLPCDLVFDSYRNEDSRLSKLRTGDFSALRSVPGATYLVGSAADIARLNGSLRPGDEVVLKDGLWTDQSFSLRYATGTFDNPIIVRPQTPGGVVLTGTSRAYFDGSHLLVSGLVFRGGHPAEGARSVSVLQLGSTVRRCDGCVVYGVTIDDFNTDDARRALEGFSVERSTWVKIFYLSATGQDITVADSVFKHLITTGKMLAAEIDPPGGTGPLRLHVVNNLFSDRPFTVNENGFEMVQFGGSGVTTHSAFSIFENNVFEDAAGEYETISVKYSDVIFRDNVFRRNKKSTLSLRAGNRILVERNRFDGDGVDGMGGVRVTGAGHWIVGNEFRNLRAPAGISYYPVVLQMGTVEFLEEWNANYARARNVVIGGNTFIDNDKGIEVGYKDSSTVVPLHPVAVHVLNNRFLFDLSKGFSDATLAAFAPFRFDNGASADGLTVADNAVALVDDILPVVTLSSPADGLVVVSSQTMTVRAAASDNRAVSRVCFFKDGVGVSTPTAPPYEATWPLTAADNGTHQWRARAFDAAGNAADTPPATVEVRIDGAPPQVAWAGPTGPFTRTQTISWEAAATDDVAVDRVVFVKDGVAIATATHPPYRCAWTVSAADNGVHAWRARAHDTSGKMAESAVVVATVAVPTPVVDDFDGNAVGGPPAGWTLVSAPNASVSVVDDVVRVPGGRSVRLLDNSATAYCQLQRAGLPVDRAYFRAAVRFAETNRKYFVFLGSGDKPETLYLLTAVNGFWRYGAADALLPGSPTFAADRWYVVELFMDFTTRSYDVWIDSRPVATGLALPGSSAALTGFRMQPATVGALGTFWADDVAFGPSPYVDVFGVEDVSDSEVALSFAANVPTSAAVVIGTAPFPTGASRADALGAAHRIPLQGLTPSTPYHYLVRLQDASSMAVFRTGRFVTPADRTPPKVEWISPNAGSVLEVEETAPLTVTATDNVGVAKVWFLRDGVVVSTATAPPYRMDWGVKPVENGARAWSARAFDAEGNWMESAPVIVEVKVPAPFSDSFDANPSGALPEGWTVFAGAGASVAVEPRAEGGKNVVLLDSSTTTFCQMARAVPDMRAVYYRASVRFGAVNQKHFIFLGDAGTGRTMYVLVAQNGFWKYSDGIADFNLPGAPGYIKDKWYAIEVALDFREGRRSATVWIDGLAYVLPPAVLRDNPKLIGLRIQQATAATLGTLRLDDVFLATARPIAAGAATTFAAVPSLPTPNFMGPRAYPVPFRPGNGAAGITFDGVSEGTRIRIFTMTGSLVTTLSVSSGGACLWNLLNDAGQTVAAGVYVVEFEGNGSRKTTRVIIQR